MAAANSANQRTLAAEDLAARLGLWSSGEGPLYQQLTAALTALIRSGDLRHGMRLPAERKLALCLSVSRGTVVGAYDRLSDAGHVSREQGRGTIVRSDGPVVDSTAARPTADALFQGARTSIDLLMAMPEVLPEVLDRIAAVDISASVDVLANAEPAGIPALRQAIADRTTAEGLPTVPEQVLVTAGAQQAITLLVALLVDPGDVVLAEETTWPGLADAVRRSGGRLVGVPLDEHGLVVEELAELVVRFQPVLIAVNPHHHNPTGSRLAPDRRRALAQLAEDYRIPVIEDRVAAHLAFDGNVPPPLAVHQARCTTLVVDSINKSAWAGLRVGWVRADSQTVADLRSHRALADLFSPIPSQLMAVAVLEGIDAILRARNDQLRRRAEVLRAEVARLLPEWDLASIRGGMVGWARLPGGRAGHVAQLAARHGVSVAAARAFSLVPDADDHIRLPFTADEALLREAVARLSRAWAELPAAGGHPSDVAAIV